MNPYLKALQEKFDGLRTGIEGMQQRAVDEKRDMTEAEFRSVKDMSEQGKALAEQIAELTEIEERSQKVSELAAKVFSGNGNGDQGDQGDEQTRGVGGAMTQPRDPGHYTRASAHSFFGDVYRARHDRSAQERLDEHTRALSTGTNGAGLVAPKWLTDEYDALARQGRAVANAVRRIDLGSDPRPITLPKQTSATTVSKQAAENDPTSDTGAYTSAVDTVSPAAVVGQQTVSRQMLDMATPAIDQLVYGDLMGAYNAQIEADVVAAILAAGPAAIAAVEDGGTGTRFDDATLAAAIAVRGARTVSPTIAAMSVARYGKFLALKDDAGRPLIPNPGTGQSVNVIGQGSVSVDGIVHGLGIIATAGATDDAKFAVVVATDVLLFETSLLEFRYEEVAGPQSVKLGVWGYSATFVKQGGKGVQTVTVGAGA